MEDIEYPVIIWLNRYAIKFVIVAFAIILEVAMLIIALVGEFSAQDWTLFYWVVPSIIIFSFILYFVIRLVYRARLECYPDEIVVVEAKKTIAFEVSDSLKIEFSKSSWDIEDGGTGIPMLFKSGDTIRIENTNQPTNGRVTALVPYKYFIILADMYPKNVEAKYRAVDL